LTSHKPVFIFLAFLMTSSVIFAQKVTDRRHVLWYTQPARNWNEALPIGNGRLAAMVFGDPQKERLQLNEETVWAGEPGNNIPKTDFYGALPDIRNLIFTGKYQEAHDLAMQKLPRAPGPDNNYGMPYQPVGNVFIEFPSHQNATHYSRSLDISRAVHTTTYKIENVSYTRETFTSFTDQVIVIRLTANKKNSITCNVTLDSPHENAEVSYANNVAKLAGLSGSHSNKKGKVRFITLAKALVEKGELNSTTSGIQIRNADAVTLFISIATNFKNYRDLSGDGEKQALQYLAKASSKKYYALQSAHSEFYKQYFDRVSLDLGTSPSQSKPTDVRLKEFKNNNDPQLVSLYFQFGRYLLICSSQPGGQPANLQGKWNDLIAPPWDSKYTININTEMNYWPAEVTNLPEMHAPLFTMLNELEMTGREVAGELYHARGWVAHHNTDLWRIAAPVDGAFYGLWPMGGAWLSQHLWQHYLYSGDEEFLKSNYHILKGAALFYLDVLQEEPSHNWSVVIPSMSPENHHRPGISIAAGTTMDNQLVFDVFSNFVNASAILKRDSQLRDSVTNKRNNLPPMQIGQHGQLQEWLEDWDKPDDKHRHVSHLYGLFPSNQISLHKNPELFQAARTSLVYRGDQSTGWSMGWKVNWWARLLDGDKAYKLIQDQLTPALENGNGAGGTYPNLLDAHPPFQIDGNFGCTSGISEMLVQSHDGVMQLLPALPSAWPTGKVTGLKTRGNFVVDMEWKDSKVTYLKITSALGGNCRIRSSSPLQNAQLIKANGPNTNPFFATEPIKPPIVSGKARLTAVSLPVVYEYDLRTEKGKAYSFKFAPL
jgi:alpha-L-fucosidase 2